MIKQILAVFRPWFWPVSIVSALVGFWHANRGLDLRVWLVVLLLAIVSAVAEVANHFADYPQDQAQKEKRLGPILLAGGSASGGEMFTSKKSMTIFLIVAGVIYLTVAVALSHSPWYLTIAILGFLMAIFYSLKPIRLKERGFWGLLSIALGRGLISFHLGWLAVASATGYSIWAGITLSILVFGTAMIAHLQDYDEDKKAGIMTFPVQVGFSRAITSCVFTIVLSCLGLALWMAYTHERNFPFLLWLFGLGSMFGASMMLIPEKELGVYLRYYQIIGLILTLLFPFAFL